MRRTNTLVFDEYIHYSATTPAVTSQELISKLGAYDQLAIQAEVDNVSGSGSGFTVQIFHGSDGRNWMAKNGSPEISGPIGASPAHFFGYDAGTKPSLGMVQLQINLPSTVSGAHVRIHVTSRDAGGR